MSRHRRRSALLWGLIGVLSYGVLVGAALLARRSIPECDGGAGGATDCRPGCGLVSYVLEGRVRGNSSG
ncbi:MAG: hypothetical protein U5K37_10735 [Natrialbaceae archaeon]|nr:hypothetical protein [Natrialbaceae archaeon]